MFFLLLAAATIFLGGNVWRIVATLRMPRPLRWDLYPIPRGPVEKQRYGGSYFEESDWWTRPAHPISLNEPFFVLKEVFLLKSVYENFHHLWLWSWLLHWGFYLYIGATGLALFPVPGSVVQLVYFVAAIVGLIGVAGLLTVRLTHARLRGYSSRATLFNLVLLGLFFATAALGATAGLNFRSAFVTTSLAIRVHLAVLAFFLIYFPFTHMTHAFMKFFTWHQVRWDDRAGIHDRSASVTLAKYLELPVTWSAPHMGSEGKRSWRDVVNEERC